MGELYDDEENITEEGNEESDESQDDFEDIEDFQYRNIREVYAARNKINQEITAQITDLRERIGRVIAALFPDRKNPSFRSVIGDLEEEIERPYTRDHPIASRVDRAITLVRQMASEYRKKDLMMEEFLKDALKLLDNSLKIYQEDMEKAQKAVQKANSPAKGFSKEQIEDPEGTDPPEDHQVTEDMVREFMGNRGKEIIKSYNQAARDGDLQRAQVIKGGFVGQATLYFKNVAKDPKSFSKQLFNYYVETPYSKLREMHKKGDSQETVESPTEPSPPTEARQEEEGKDE